MFGDVTKIKILDFKDYRLGCKMIMELIYYEAFTLLRQLVLAAVMDKYKLNR